MSYLEQSKTLLRRRLPVCEARKIFCLSLPKSGTTSFQRYLTAGGLTIAGSGPVYELLKDPPATRVERFCDLLISRLEERDGFQDQPWGFFADVFREKFPNARYVILTRPFASWLKSLRFHILGRPETDVFLREFLGVPGDDAPEEVFREAYDAHYLRCAQATRDAPALTIRIDIEDSPSICAKLNAFLGLSVERFPHEIRHQSQLTYQVRTALGTGRNEDAKAVLAKYRAIHGDDDACARAEKMIAAAVTERRN